VEKNPVKLDLILTDGYNSEKKPRVENFRGKSEAQLLENPEECMQMSQRLNTGTWVKDNGESKLQYPKKLLGNRTGGLFNENLSENISRHAAIFSHEAVISTQRKSIEDLSVACEILLTEKSTLLTEIDRLKFEMEEFRKSSIAHSTFLEEKIAELVSRINAQK